TARAHTAEGDAPSGRKATGIEDKLVGVVEPTDGQRGSPADASSSDRKVLDRSVEALAREPLATAALRHRVCNIDECHRILTNMQCLDDLVSGGIDHIDFVGVLEADVDASVVGAGPHAVRPMAVIRDPGD